MKNPKILAVCAFLVAFSLAGSSQAATKPQITDIRGDANALNDQGPGITIPTNGPTTPRAYDPADILNVLVSTQYAKIGKVVKPVYVTVTMNLAASPTSDTYPKRYRVYFTSPGCASGQLEYDYTPAMPSGIPNELDLVATTVILWTPGFRLSGCIAGSDINLTQSKVVKNSVVWRIPFAMVGKLGQMMGDLRAETRFRARGAYPVPVIDLARGPVDKYKLGA
jgi:hypothetical protein